MRSKFYNSSGLFTESVLANTAGGTRHAILQFPLDGATLTQITQMPVILSQPKEPITPPSQSISISISFLLGEIVFNKLCGINGNIFQPLSFQCEYFPFWTVFMLMDF